MEHHHASEGEAHHKPKQVTLRLSTRTIRITVAVVVLFALAYYGKGVFVSASVNGTLISRFAVIKELESVSGKQALDSLIAQKLIYDEAKQKGIVVTDEELNSEVAKVEEQVNAQGGTLEQALQAQGMIVETLKKQLRTQKFLEKLVSGSTQVSDEEIAQFIVANNVSVPKGQEAQYNDLVKNQLIQQKLNAAKTSYVSELRSKAKIRIFADY